MANCIKMRMSDAFLRVIQDQCDQLLANHNAAAATDVLHEIVLEGRARKQVGQHSASKDIWTPDLKPQSAVQARTIPVLEAERERMLAELDKVCRAVCVCPSLKADEMHCMFSWQERTRG